MRVMRILSGLWLSLFAVSAGCDGAETVGVRVGAMDAPVGARATWTIGTSNGVSGSMIEVVSPAATEAGIPAFTAHLPCEGEDMMTVNAELVAVTRADGTSAAVLPTARQLVVGQVWCGEAEVAFDVVSGATDAAGFFESLAPFEADGAVMIEGMSCSAATRCDADTGAVALEVGCVAGEGAAIELRVARARLVCREARDAELYDRLVWNASGDIDEAVASGSTREALREGGVCALSYGVTLDKAALASQRCWLDGAAVPTRESAGRVGSFLYRPTLQWHVEVLAPDGRMCGDARFGTDDLDHEEGVDLADRKDGVFARYSLMPYGTRVVASGSSLTRITVEPLDLGFGPAGETLSCD